jgi:hypothetical protein
VWVVAFVLVVVVENVTGPGFREWHRLSVHGRHTYATITGLDLAEHQACNYVYKVNGVTYHSGDVGCGESRKVGTRIRVTYDPTKPSVAMSGSPRAELSSDIEGALFIATIVSGVAFFSATRNPRWPSNSQRRRWGRGEPS